MFFFILLALALLFVWGAVYIWPEALEWLDPVSTRVELTLILVGIPLLLTGLYYSWKFWRQRQKRLQQDQSLQYLKREKTTPELKLEKITEAAETAIRWRQSLYPALAADAGR